MKDAKKKRMWWHAVSTNPIVCHISANHMLWLLVDFIRSQYG